MLVPEYWAEARVVGKVGDRQRVIRRFGWSDDGEADAERHALERAHEALKRLQQGEKVAPRDPKVVYGGAHGLPIREQIVARTERDVVTRNTYGARCLNVPDVMFVDIDEDSQPVEGCGAMLALLGVFVGSVLLAMQEIPFTVEVATGALLALVATFVIAGVRRRARGPRMLARVREYAAADRRRRLALYETPAGLRVLVLHETFDPTSDEARRVLAELRADPVYARMCRLQACFRARVSPKPWRMGMTEHIKPRPGIWPVNPARRPEREAWIARYEEMAKGWAACRFVEELGQGTVESRCAEVQRIHDEMCRARADLPIA